MHLCLQHASLLTAKVPDIHDVVYSIAIRFVVQYMHTSFRLIGATLSDRHHVVWIAPALFG